MEENILIKSKHYDLKKFTMVVAALSIIASIFMFSYFAIHNYKYYSSQYHQEKWNPTYLCKHTQSDYSTYKVGTKTYKREIKAEAQTREAFEKIHPNVMSYIRCKRGGSGLLYQSEKLASLIPLSAGLLALILYLLLSGYSLTVTDKRIYATAPFGRRLDLPFDKISAVGTCFLKGIYIGAPSGKIKLKFIKNNVDVHYIICNMLAERQPTKQTNDNQNIQNSNNLDNLDESKKSNDLPDSNVITQDEFDENRTEPL